MLTSNIQAICPGRFILPPPHPPPHSELQREWIIRTFYYTIYYRNIRVERDINFISVNLRCNFKFLVGLRSVGLRIDKGWRASFPGQFILHPSQTYQLGCEFQRELIIHKFSTYLVERDINFISVNLRCLLHRNICPPPSISKRMDNQQTLFQYFRKYLVERDINFISVNLKRFSVG